MNLHKAQIIDFPKIPDERGNLSFFENEKQLPFTIQRVYWIYDVPGGEMRGGHAYHHLEEVIVALSGSFDVVLHNGNEEHRFTLNRSHYGLYIPKMIWRRMENFSTNALAFVAANASYDESDYIRNFTEFQQLIQDASNRI
ncbi:MAG: WxcM-like domain-containing protein [Sphingobacteriales bacterium]|nr:MAG: WxcM-like domain-containing protein [Sphingobacteriales bacterium]